MAQNPMMGAPIQPAAPSSPQGLNFQSDPSNRASFKGFMTSLNALPNISAPPPAPMPAPMVPAADVDIFQPMPMQMASVTTSIHVWVRWMHAACAMALVQCTNVVAQTSRRETAIAMAINLTPSAFAEVHAMPTRMRTGFVMMSTIV